jgi:hypothetical protein
MVMPTCGVPVELTSGFGSRLPAIGRRRGQIAGMVRQMPPYRAISWLAGEADE